MIGFESTETSFTEGFLKDAIKDAGKMVNIDTDKVKEDAKDVKNATDPAYKIQGANKVVNDDVLKPAADKIDDISKSVSSGKINRRSIIARAKNSVMYFPVYITQSVSVNAAQIIAELFERVYASLMQSILSQNPIIDESEANDLLFLKKFHTNINESADIELYNEFYTPIDDVDSMMKESVFYREQITPTMEVTFRAIPFEDAHLMLEHARMQHNHLEGLNYIREAADDDKSNHNMAKDETVKRDKVTEKELEDLAGEKGISTAELKRQIKDKKISGMTYTNGAYYRGVATVTKKYDSKGVDSPKLLRDNDVKKINAMAPWMIEASFRIKGSNGSSPRDVHYVLGIKTNLHLIYTQDLAEDLRELVTGNMKSLQKVRYKTGEITFADYMFNKKGIKADAAKSINYNKRWLNTLKRLGEWEKLNGSLLDAPAKFINSGKDIPIPNGTLVLAQTDVTTMTEQTGIDLSIVSNAKRLARSLFLIAICIVDSSAGKMRVLFPDNSSEWDVQSLASIDAEVSKTDNSQLMRELNRMINH